jgi:retron-type reverse transcriptase
MFQSGSEGRAARQRAVLTRLLSPLLANIALTALDEHLMGPWKTGGAMSTGDRRTARRHNGLPNWRIVRYADDFAVLVNGSSRTLERCANRSRRYWPRWGCAFLKPRPAWCT